MNSRVTMGLAAILLLGAIFVGYWGLVLSRQPAPVAVAPVAPTVTVEKLSRSPKTRPANPWWCCCTMCHPSLR